MPVPRKRPSDSSESSSRRMYSGAIAAMLSPLRDTITARSFDPKLRHQGRSHIGVWNGVTFCLRQSSSQGVSRASSVSIAVITSDMGGGLYERVKGEE